MALRARLAAPATSPPADWPYHRLTSASVPVSLLVRGDRRLEAETYLSTGFGIRAAIEAKEKGWARYESLAKVWMPGRLKGIQVSSEFGTPFLAATQVFDIRPVPRKWLSLERTSDVHQRFVAPGTILVTCSGSVGRPTLAHDPHRGMLISHDLLRVEAVKDRDYGWLYASLLSRQVRAMATGAQYGHIIKHLEVSHLNALPVPEVPDHVAAEFSDRVRRIIELRNEGYQLTLDAEAMFEDAIGPITVSDWGETGFSVRASRALTSHNRRLEASVHNPGVSMIRNHLAKKGRQFTTVSEAGFDVWVPGRYTRIPAENGVVYRDSADLLEVSPDLSKRFRDCQFGDEFQGRVKRGWVLVPSSGQVYGIIGSATLATQALDNQVVSNHVIRIAPKREPSIRVGYLVTALSHLKWGRPLVKSLAFGSSVPEIDPADLARFKIVRLSRETESAIADLAEGSANARAEADILEREIAKDAAKIIDRFIRDV